MKEQIITSLFMVGAIISAFAMNQNLNRLSHEVERVKVESIVSSGKAIYMPGSVCIIKATSDIDQIKMREFAAVCVKSHEKWLLMTKDDAIYSNGSKEVQP